MKDSALNSLGTINGAVSIAIIGFISILVFILIKFFNIDVKEIALNIVRKIISLSGKTINNKELKYHRDLAIGKINEKTKRVKTYRFLNDLIIDLGLKKKGATPYEFLAFVLVGTLLISLIFCELIFQ